MLALVWTLPVQKALLLLGLFWAHERAPQRADIFALMPEIAVAVLVSGMLPHCSAQRWLHAGLALGTSILVILSWLVIGAWLVAGVPFSYQMLGRLVSEPAVLHTATTSPTVLFQFLVFVAGLPLLWGMGHGLRRYVAKSGIGHYWRHRGRLSPVFVGVGTMGLLGTLQAPTLTTQLALVAPLFNERMPHIFSRASLDPATLAVLQAPQRRSLEGLPPLTKPQPHVVLLVLESIRWQAGSLFDRGFPHAVHFDRVYAHDPRSVKTLEALLFGLYPSPTQVTAAWSIDTYAVERMAPLPRLLGEQGYETTYYSAMNPAFDNYGVVMKAAGVKQIELVSGGQQLSWGSDVATVLKRVTERLAYGVRHQHPQFIMAWTSECHMPYDYAAGQPVPSSREQYLACHHSVAQSVEAFTQQLERDGRFADTLVVILGDHGEIFPEEKAGEWGHGFHVYEPSVRIPVLMFGPGMAGGRHDTRLFQPVDIPVTILEQLGLLVPREWVGRNMLDVAAPGRDFAILLNSVAGGAIGIVETAEKKYVRRAVDGPLLSYDLKDDPTEQVELPVSPALTTAVTHKFATYLSFVAHQWESRRVADAESPRTWPGRTLHQWFRGACVTVTPDQRTDTASIQPVRSSECDQAEGPDKRVFFQPLRRAPFEEGVRIQLELRIDALADLTGRPLRAWGKASIAEPLVHTPVQPVVGEWQTITLSLPKLAPTTDPKDLQESATILFMMTPLDVPAQYTLRSVTVEPVTQSVPDRLRAWWAARVG